MQNYFKSIISLTTQSTLAHTTNEIHNEVVIRTVHY